MGVGGWLADLLGYKDLLDANGNLLPRRNRIRFTSGVASDNPTLQATDISAGAAIPVAVVIDSDVPDLNAGPLSWLGYTLLPNDIVAIRGTRNRLYYYQGGGAYVELGAQPADNTQLVTIKGLPSYLLYYYQLGVVAPVNSGNTATSVGPNGCVQRTLLDAPGYTKQLTDNALAPKVTIANGVTVTLFSFDTNVEGFTAGNAWLAFQVQWLNPSGSNDYWANQVVTFRATQPPTLLRWGPTDIVDETSAGAAGVIGGHFTLAFRITGNAVELRCTNNTGASADIATIASGSVTQS